MPITCLYGPYLALLCTRFTAITINNNTYGCWTPDTARVHAKCAIMTAAVRKYI